MHAMMVLVEVGFGAESLATFSTSELLFWVCFLFRASRTLHHTIALTVEDRRCRFHYVCLDFMVRLEVQPIREITEGCV